MDEIKKETGEVVADGAGFVHDYHFVFGSPEEQAGKLEGERQAISNLLGRVMDIASTRQSHHIDDKGRDVYEMWATFKPRPKPPVPNATQV